MLEKTDNSTRRHESTRKSEQSRKLVTHIAHERPKPFALLSHVEDAFLRVEEVEVVSSLRENDFSIEEGEAELAEALGDEEEMRRAAEGLWIRVGCENGGA